MFAELRESTITSETSWKSGENTSTADATYRYMNLKFVQVKPKDSNFVYPSEKKNFARGLSPWTV